MKKLTQLLVLLILITDAGAQDLKYAKYNWNDSPKPYVLKASEKGIEEIIIKDKQAAEYVYTPEYQLQKYEFVHRVIVVNSADAISNNNKIYIPGGIGFVYQRARVISPTGKVTVFSEKDIKEAVDEDSKAKYRYFALD